MEKGIGDGMIFSPVNIDFEKLKVIGKKDVSILDPQLYLLNESKGVLDTYPYFPGNLKDDFSTVDLEKFDYAIASKCIDVQKDLNFQYFVIPTRYYEENPSSYFEQVKESFILPFSRYIRKNNLDKKVLITVIVKQSMVIDEEKRSEVLNWITGINSIDGVYIIFENNFTSKQIKDFNYLFGVLKILKVLKDNHLEVHIGYTNTEAILYSIAQPDSVSMGSYENLRSFNIKRFKDQESGQGRAPRARLYSSKLLQWVDHQYINAMQQMIPDYESYFDESEFTPLMFVPEFNWHFTKSEIYKHYFAVFYKQIKAIPNENEKVGDHLKIMITNAIKSFRSIEEMVALDEDSDGSHLPTWWNVLNAFLKLGI
jgi:hypothetical protein